VFSVITYLVQKGAGAMMNGEARPLAARIGNALVSYATYLRKAAWPDDLAALYIHRKSSLGYVIGAAAILLAITAITILMHRRAAYLAMGWLWYLGTLVPVIGIVQVGSQTMADRFTYLPLVGIFIAVVWGIADICGNARAHLPYVYFARFGIAVILSVFSILTWRQIYFWRDSEALYKRILAVYPYTGSAHYDLGLVYSAQNKRAQAIEQYQAAVRCNPEKPEPRYNLGRELMLAGRLAEAREQCEMTLHYHPRFDEAEYTLAMVLVKSGDAAEALGHFKAATQINPSRSQYFNDLGVCCANLGQITNAIAAFENATQLDPNNSDAQRNLAQARADSHTNSVPNSQK
jgi:tetratricopeptide (TPR) repeat protein